MARLRTRDWVSPTWFLLFLSFVAAAIPAASALGIANWLTNSPLPFEDSAALRFLFSADPSSDDYYDGISGAEVKVWLDSAPAESLGAFSTPRAMILEGERTDQVLVTFATPNVLAIGRIRIEVGTSPGDPQEAVCTEAFAKRRFGSAVAALSEQIVLGDQALTIVGVLDPAFEGFLQGRTELLLPLRSARMFFSESFFEDPDLQWLVGIARVDGPLSEPKLVQQLEQSSNAMAQRFPSSHRNRIVQMESAQSWFFGETFRSALSLMLLAAGLTSLGAVANLAGLVDSELRSQHGNLMIRSALGAQSGSLSGKLVLQILLWSSVGLLWGLYLGVRLTQFAVQASGETPPSYSQSVLFPRVKLAWFFVVSVMLLTVLVSVWVSVRVRAVCAQGTRQWRVTTSPPGKTRLAHAVGLLALCGATLTTSLLAAQSLRLLSRSSLGLPADLTYLPLKLPPRLGGVQHAPAIRSLMASLNSDTDLSETTLMGPDVAPSAYFGSTIVFPERDEADSRVSVYRHSVGDGFARVVGLASPSLELDQRPFGQPSGQVLVSASLANRAWGGDALGREFKVTPKAGLTELWTVVGVVPDILHRGRREPNALDVYFPLSQVPSDQLFLVSRGELGEDSYQGARTVVEHWASDAVLGPPETLGQRIRDETRLESLVALVSGILASIAFALAAIGTYGIVASDSRARAREWTIRRALGLTASDVFRSILTKAVLLTGISGAIGVAFAVAFGGALRDVFFGVTTSDPFTAILVLLVLVLTGAAAALLPALRVARASPSEVLKSE